MNVKAKVFQVKGNKAAIEILSDKFRLKEGEYVTIRKGSQRTNSQNALYWAYLTWLVNDAGLRDQARSPEGLHEDLKAYLISEIGTTTVLNKMEFGEYLERCRDVIREVLQINDQPYWDSHNERSLG